MKVKLRVVPAGCDEYDHGDEDGSADGSTGGDCDFIHIGSGRCDGSYLATLTVRHAIGRHVDLLQRNNAHNDALSRGDVLDLELPLACF